jgi:hypothetical protein
MLLSILRSIGSVLLGLVAAFAFLIAAEGISYILHPPPPGLRHDDMSGISEHVARYPPSVLALCTAIWALGPFTGAWLATRLGTGRHAAHGIVVGALMLALAACNLSMLPYPVWFPPVVTVTFVLGTFLAIWLARPAKPPPGAALAAK